MTRIALTGRAALVAMRIAILGLCSAQCFASTAARGRDAGEWRRVIAQWQAESGSGRVARDTVSVRVPPERSARPGGAHADALGSFTARALNGIAEAKGRALLEKSEYRLAGYDVAVLPRDLEWSEDPHQSRTWQWALHSMFHVRDLMGAYWGTRNQAYLERAKQSAWDWIHDNCIPSPPSPFSWNDHTTALRLRHLLILWQLCSLLPDDTGFLDDVLAAVELHCRVLALDSFHSFHSNHGLDQALSHFLAASVFTNLPGSFAWQALARSRVIDEVGFMYTGEGVHTENSPSYHLWTLPVLEEAVLLMEEFGGGTVITPDLHRKAYEYLKAATLPNGQFPLFGDSTDHRVAIPLPASLAGRDEILYAISLGTQGHMPLSDPVTFYPESGYVYCRSGWGTAAAFSDAVHLSFKARNQGRYHRQLDDLTFCLYGFGERWIVDSGKYKYEPHDPVRAYMRGLLAHNLVVIDGAWEEGLKLFDDVESCIERSARLADGAYVKATCRYGGYGVHVREIAYVHPDVVAIRDRAIADTRLRLFSHRFRLLFHVEPSKRVTNDGSSYVIESTRDAERWLAVVSCEPGGLSHGVVKGQMQPFVQGWVSTDGLQAVPAPVIRYDKRGKEASFETLLFFGEGPVPSSRALRMLARDAEDRASRVWRSAEQ